MILDFKNDDLNNITTTIILDIKKDTLETISNGDLVFLENILRTLKNSQTFFPLICEKRPLYKKASLFFMMQILATRSTRRKRRGVAIIHFDESASSSLFKP